MSDLEARITEVLAPLLHGEGRLQWERKWEDSSPLVKSAWSVLAREYATMLAPVIREREAEAWDEGRSACDREWYEMTSGVSAHDTGSAHETPNPYRADNLEAS